MAKIMKDGKPSTSFSRQDREWVKSMRGGDAPSGTITITENGEYDVTNYATADVQVEGGSSDFTETTITLVVTENGDYLTVIGFLEGGVNEETGQLNAYIMNNGTPTDISFLYSEGVSYNEGTHEIPVYMSDGATVRMGFVQGTVTNTTGSVVYDSETQSYIISGDCTIAITASGS